MHCKIYKYDQNAYGRYQTNSLYSIRAQKHTHALTHRSLALLPAAWKHLPAAPSSGSLWTPVKTCRNIGLTWAHPSHAHKRFQIRMIRSQPFLHYSQHKYTTFLHKTYLYSVASDQRKRKTLGKKSKSDRNGRGSSEERSKRRLFYFTLCLWAPVWCSMCVCVCVCVIRDPACLSLGYFPAASWRLVNWNAS